MTEKIKHVTDMSFEKDVLNSQTPVLVDFWAPWCAPCLMLTPIMEQLAAEYAGKTTFARMNTDENPDTPTRLGIRGIPTLIVYVDGEEADRMVGVAPKAVLQRKLDAVLAEAGGQ